MLGFPSPPAARRALACALVVASALASTLAVADPPPDLPPLPGSAVTPAPALGTPPPGLPATLAPGSGPGPTFYPFPGGPTTPGEVPPGYTVPYYFAPYMMPQAARPASLEIPPLPPRMRHSAGLMAGGILMVAAGTAAVVLGAVLVSSSADRIDIYCDMPSFPCAHEDDQTRKVGGALMMAAGAVVAAAGIPLWVTGARMELVAKTPDSAPTPPKPAALSPELRVGAGTASLLVRF
jgi:hypothetical protein